MTLIELLLLALGLSMDAFAVAVCKGLSLNKLSLRSALIVGGWFGGFQAVMPLLGYLLGMHLADYIRALSHWVAFALLAAIGVNMIREALSKKDGQGDKGGGDCSLGARAMFVMAVATSIDALAVGVTFGFLQVPIAPAVATIGVMTFILSAAGVRIGQVFGARFQTPAGILGGVILCGLGLRILLEQLGVVAP